MAGEHGVYVALAQLVGFEGGKAFPGGSLVATPRGDLLAEAPVFDEAVHADDARLRGDHPGARRSPAARRPGDAAAASAGLAARRASWRATGRRREAARPAAKHGAGASARTAPRPALAPIAMRARPDRDPLAIDPELTRRWLVEFIRDEVQRRRGFERVVIGLSGGVDSSLVAYLAAEALGAGNVLGVRMPYRTSSPESLAHAQLVIDALGIPARDGGHQRGGGRSRRGRAGDAGPGRLGNIMARTRMITLFDLSAAHRALPLGTGNKTERLFGYFTWHADDSPPVNPIGDLFKTQVWALARHLGVPGRHRLQARERRPHQGTDRRGRLRHQLSAGRRDPPLDPARATRRRRSPRWAIARGGSRAGAEAPRFHPLEAAASDGRDAERDGDRRVLSEAGGLLTR